MNSILYFMIADHVWEQLKTHHKEEDIRQVI